MKKTFLTFLALGFGFSTAFAQTAEPAATEQTETVETIEQAQPADDMTGSGMTMDAPGRTETELAATPAAVQDAFKNSEYSDLEVLAVYEVTDKEGIQATVYEFELAPKAENAEATETEGVVTENVNNSQPELVLYIDENGAITEEENAGEME